MRDDARLAGDDQRDELTVGEVAQLSGVTVRTLHHYDGIGLLVPGGRSRAGYRLYTRSDVERLQEILFYRELGVGLAQIREVLGGSERDRLTTLRSQRRQLVQRRSRLNELLEAIDRAIRSEEKGETMSEKEMLEVFDGFDPRVHEEEVQRRWGESTAYEESSRRTKRYTPDDWKRIKAREQEIVAQLAEALKAGLEPTSDTAADLAEAHRLHIHESYYSCSHQHHVALADLYVHDERFSAYWEAAATGLTEFVRDAIATNTLRSSEARLRPGSE